LNSKLPKNEIVLTPESLQPVQKLNALPIGTTYFLPVSSYPIPEAEGNWVKDFCEALIAKIRATDTKLRLEVVIRQNGLYTGLVDHFIDNASKWMPEQGVAVIPHKPPPHVPTKSEIESIDPRALDKGGQIPSLSGIPELIFRVSDDTSKEVALKTLGGHSALNIFLTRMDAPSLVNRWKEVFGKRVTDRLFRAMPIFVPLFGIQSFNDIPKEELELWFTSFDFYIGESMDDVGIVILSKENIDLVIADLVDNLPVPVIEPEAEILRW
jgi:hypothetical protein